MSPTRTSAVVSRKLNLGFKDGPNLTSRKKEHVLLKDVSGKLFFVCTAEFFFSEIISGTGLKMTNVVRTKNERLNMRPNMTNRIQSSYH